MSYRKFAAPSRRVTWYRAGSPSAETGQPPERSCTPGGAPPDHHPAMRPGTYTLYIVYNFFGALGLAAMLTTGACGRLTDDSPGGDGSVPPGTPDAAMPPPGTRDAAVPPPGT